jgi:hypothetical protein
MNVFKNLESNWEDVKGHIGRHKVHVIPITSQFVNA